MVTSQLILKYKVYKQNEPYHTTVSTRESP
jgi:hypothetical protein